MFQPWTTRAQYYGPNQPQLPYQTSHCYPSKYHPVLVRDGGAHIPIAQQLPSSASQPKKGGNIVTQQQRQAVGHSSVLQSKKASESSSQSNTVSNNSNQQPTQSIQPKDNIQPSSNQIPPWLFPTMGYPPFIPQPTLHQSTIPHNVTDSLPQPFQVTHTNPCAQQQLLSQSHADSQQYYQNTTSNMTQFPNVQTPYPQLPFQFPPIASSRPEMQQIIPTMPKQQTAPTKHRCIACGRSRSARYHAQLQSDPSRAAEPAICRRCLTKKTIHEETDSDDTEETESNHIRNFSKKARRQVLRSRDRGSPRARSSSQYGEPLRPDSFTSRAANDSISDFEYDAKEVIYLRHPPNFRKLTSDPEFMKYFPAQASTFQPPKPRKRTIIYVDNSSAPFSQTKQAPPAGEEEEEEEEEVEVRYIEAPVQSRGRSKARYETSQTYHPLCRPSRAQLRRGSCATDQIHYSPSHDLHSQTFDHETGRANSDRYSEDSYLDTSRRRGTNGSQASSEQHQLLHTISRAADSGSSQNGIQAYSARTDRMRGQSIPRKSKSSVQDQVWAKVNHEADFKSQRESSETGSLTRSTSDGSYAVPPNYGHYGSDSIRQAEATTQGPMSRASERETGDSWGGKWSVDGESSSANDYDMYDRNGMRVRVREM